MIPALSSASAIPIAPPVGTSAGVSGSRTSDETIRVRESVPQSRVGGPGTAEDEASTTEPRTESSPNPSALDDQQLQELQQLKARDREVRAHEAAHQAVGGRFAGAVSYTYQRGPDGNQYAIGGEVSIDISPVQGDPRATIEKMRIVKAAAMAPAQPSAQDRAVAAQATQLLLQAQAELAAQAGDSDASANPVKPSVESSSAIDTYRSVAGEPVADDAGNTGVSRSVFQATA